VDSTTQSRHEAGSPRGGALSVAAAWMVHIYTASGTVLAMLTVIAVLEGDTVRALWLGLAAMVVDGTDGMLARHLEVKRWVPWFDGALLDNIVDYLTYAFTPMVLLWSTGYLGEGTSATLLSVMPLLASAYQFCRVDAKTEDHLFLGFPSYWNVVAFYVIVLDLEPTAVAVLLTVCAALVFIPVGYVYPSRTDTLRGLTLVLTTLWLVSYAVLLSQLPSPSTVWLTISLVYVVYYVALSLHLTVRRSRA
jgi:phosphatidylcholine synthase